MDRLTQYQNAVKACLLDWHEYVSRATPKNGTEAECLFDDTRGNYMLVFVGWHEGTRKQSVSIFVRIKNGKIWIEDDWTVSPPTSSNRGSRNATSYLGSSHPRNATSANSLLHESLSPAFGRTM